MARQLGAACDRRGVIEFVRSVPMGMLLIARGPATRLREVVSATARHAYDGKTLLVPGLPEADSDEAAVDALKTYQDRVDARLTAVAAQ